MIVLGNCVEKEKGAAVGRALKIALYF